MKLLTTGGGRGGIMEGGGGGVKLAGETLSVTPREQQPAWKHTTRSGEILIRHSFVIFLLLCLTAVNAWKDKQSRFSHVHNESETKLTH